MPSDYLVFRAASLCHCPPWEIEDRDDFWLEKVLLYDSAEGEAHSMRVKQEKLKKRKR